MKLLLDTHALLWWLADDDRLGTQARALIEDHANDVLVGVASLWESVVKVRVGKLEADIEEVAATVERGRFTPLGIGLAHLAALAALPAFHRDPFDHLLLAQAMAENATFVSDDQPVPRYPARFVRCSEAPSPMG